MKKAITITLEEDLWELATQSGNKSAKVEDLMRKGLLFEQGSYKEQNAKEQVYIVAEILNSLKGTIGNIEHICTCIQEAKEVKEEVKKPTKKEVVKDIVTEAPQTVEPIKETTQEVKEEETFNVDIPNVYQTEHFKGTFLDSVEVSTEAFDTTLLKTGNDLIYICLVNEEPILVYKEDGHNIAYELDGFKSENKYRGKEVYTSKANVYNFLKEWGVID